MKNQGVPKKGDDIMLIRKLKNEEVPHALALVLEVFMQFEAPDYSERGVETFKRTGIEDKEYVANLLMYGAFHKGKLNGVIATRNNGSHIALFFVKGEYHRHGIGTKLFNAVLANSKEDIITVNSSPYAKDVYHHLGFMDTDTEQTIEGIRFIPMVYQR